MLGYDDDDANGGDGGGGGSVIAGFIGVDCITGGCSPCRDQARVKRSHSCARRLR